MLGLVIFLVLASALLTTWVLLPGGLESVVSLIVDGVRYRQQLPQNGATLAPWLAVFAMVSFCLQLLVVPSGSLLLIGAGFVLGVVPSVLIYTAMQCLAIFPVYRLCEYSRINNLLGLQRKLDAWIEKSGILRIAGAEPLVSGMVLRLTPVLPSAVATGVAAFSAIPVWMFLLATLVVGWVRPLFFASVGGAASELSGFATALSGDFRVGPLIAVFLATVLLLAVRLWLRYRSGG